MLSRSLIFGLTALVASSALAADYTLQPNPADGTATITLQIKGKPSNQFRMPAWAPGDYEIFNYGQYISDVQFSLKGKSVTGKNEADLNLWTIPEGADTVNYKVKPSPGNFSPNLRVKEREAFISGPGVLGWFNGHDREAHTLGLKKLTPTDLCATALAQSDKGDTIALTATNYDELLDSPTAWGPDIKLHTFTVGGKPHVVAAYGRNQSVDLPSFETMTTKLITENQKMFGELPYPRYYFMCDFGGGGGGLEHLNSARLGLWSTNANSSISFISHEYFHLFNVKRIRPKVLGPFDYTKPAVNSYLWWLEGVTDYYASVIAYRAGLITRKQLLNDLGGSAFSIGRNQTALKYSAAEVSRRVWEGGGSNGFQGLSYYEKGRVIGLALDLAIRQHSAGKHSLDSVIVQLFNECKGSKPGYADGRIRELCIQFGGPKLGPIYDKCVDQPVPMPWDEVLPGMGLALSNRSLVEVENAAPTSTDLRSKWPNLQK